MIFRFGRLKHTGRDFNRDRAKALEPLEQFTQRQAFSINPLKLVHPVRNLLMKNLYLRSIISAATLTRQSLTPHGGHIHASFVNVSYIRIPKAASTSLSYAMLEVNYPDLKPIPLSETEINFLADANLKRHVTSSDINDIFFTVVRNPFARIVSVYRDFISTSARDFIYDDYLFGILQREISFKEFVRRIDGIPALLLDPHIKPQHYFIDYYRRKNPNIVMLKLEKPEEVNSFLALYSLESHFLNKSPERYDYKTYYDRETYDLVARVYKHDLKMFGYEQESRQLREHLTSQ